ncbi:nucleoside deaminase [Cryptosporangium phraense]|uniref:Nucleoside deaminase n=1 Tax=Cryptosporangium phraense TaxID=2593070 RepID=A0A545AZQ6_9ACTN|nr:nucleoside deaminase [Cryptosporangium phraense]TQS46802.1 nucleoside deaminase [Cryptosporangium phraense]
MKVETHFGAALPDWVSAELAEVPAQTHSDAERMALVHRLAARNHVEGNGGPFAAVVAERATGRIVSVGVNVVLSSGLSSMHAEVVALSLAQVAASAWDLGAAGGPAHELVVNWRPCAMCYGAVLWSGVTRLVVAGSGPELEQLTGFDEGPVRDDWDAQLAARGIEVVQDVLRNEALAVFADYGGTQALVYNGRGGSR